jgi:tetratricopeptide (TPR) repeat protein
LKTKLFLLFPCLLLLLLGSHQELMAKDFFTKQQTEVYFLYWDAQFDEADELLAKDAKTNPADAAYYVLKSTGLTLQLMLEGNMNRYYQFKKKEKEWTDSLEIVRDEASRLYAQAIVKLHWALLKTLYGEGLSGAWAMRQVFLSLKQINTKYPLFMPAKVYYGALQVATANIPDSYQWAAQLAGLKGNEQQGWLLLKMAQSKPQSVEAFEATLFTLVLKNYLEYSRAEVLVHVKQLSEAHRCHLLYLMLAWACDKNNASAKAHELLMDCKVAYTFHYYVRGVNAMQRLQLDEAKSHFTRYLKEDKSRNYRKDILYRLSLIAHLQGDSLLATRYRERLKKQGNDLFYADKRAAKQVFLPYPNHDLQIAKWVFEGGDHQRSLQMLNLFTPADPSLSLEKQYLIARNYHVYDDLDEAIKHYKMVAEKCPKEGVYLGPMSCLQISTLCFAQGRKPLCLAYLDLLGRFRNYEHQKYIQDKASSLRRACQ